MYKLFGLLLLSTVNANATNYSITISDIDDDVQITCGKKITGKHTIAYCSDSNVSFIKVNDGYKPIPMKKKKKNKPIQKKEVTKEKASKHYDNPFRPLLKKF